jgi:cysteine desulfurase/selenocysteine lyase
MNMIAEGLRLSPGDRVVTTDQEHHGGELCWRWLERRRGIAIDTVAVPPGTSDAQAILDASTKVITPATKVISFSHILYSTGLQMPVAELCALARNRGCLAVVDGAQAVAHTKVNVQDLDCDFYAFSGHKLYGPTGIGVLYGRERLMEGLPPYQGGGGMIDSVAFEGTEYGALPHRFEAGTPHVAGALGLASAIDYITNLGLDLISDHEHELLMYGTAALSEVPGLRLTGTAPEKTGILAFIIAGVHPHDIGTILDRSGVAIRTGHHCCQPLMARLGVPATARASLALYNTRDEIDALVEGLHEVGALFT